MNKTAALSVILIAGLLLSACLPAFPTQPALNTPQASGSTVIPATPTPALSLITPTTMLPPTGTFTSIPSLTPLSTGATAIQEVTSTPLTDTPGATVTPDQPISIDKLPPGTVYGKIHVQNKSGTQVDISLHCTTRKGLQTILEYDRVRNIYIQAPQGDYVYVVYVGGRRLIGSFSFPATNTLTLTVYKDKVAIH